jgi:hypothetical protein
MASPPLKKERAFVMAKHNPAPPYFQNLQKYFKNLQNQISLTSFAWMFGGICLSLQILN